VNRLPDVPTEEISDLLAGYALGALEPDERDFIARNLPRKPAWRRELETYREVANQLAYAPDATDVPLRARAAVLAHIDAIESGIPIGENAAWNATLPALLSADPPTPPAGWRRRLPRIAMTVAVPATVVAIVFAMYTVVMHGQFSEQQDELAAYQQAQGETVEVLTSDPQSQQVIELVETRQAPLARGRLFIDYHANSAMLVARDLPPLPDDQTYVVWMVIDTVANEFARAGVLEVNESGTGQLIINPPDAFDRYLTVTVTRETGLDTYKPSGPEVMAANI
jgi:hypothetical protein